MIFFMQFSHEFLVEEHVKYILKECGSFPTFLVHKAEEFLCELQKANKKASEIIYIYIYIYYSWCNLEVVGTYIEPCQGQLECSGR
jgi:hypothetical protein